MFKGSKVIVVMPAYNAEKTLRATVAEVDRDIVDEIILVDDASKDSTVKLATELGLRVYRHEINLGYGGNQKTCYREALAHGADIVVMVHPDYQYTPKLIPAMVAMIASGLYDVVLGSRILGGKALEGGMPYYKYAANRLLTAAQNLLTGMKLSEYHTGYRVFSRRVLETLPLERNSNDFIFDNEILLQAHAAKFQIAELTCPTKYFADASSINFKRSLVYGIGCLRNSVTFAFQERWAGGDERRRQALAGSPHASSIYDKNDYYSGHTASRLWPALDPLLHWLEWTKVNSVLGKMKKREGNVLDVGTADGQFLEIMRRFGCKIQGTSNSQISVQAATNKLGDGVVSLATGLDSAVTKGPFDLITYWHVFEHLENSQDHVNRWKDLLADDGLLVVEVPNVASLGARMNFKSWLGSDTQHHINMKSHDELSALIKGAGLQVEKIEQFSVKFSYVFLWSSTLGTLFPTSYDFDSIMNILKQPVKRMLEAPLMTCNAILSVAYLAPFVLMLMAFGLVTQQGEVVRVYARKAPENPPRLRVAS